MSIVSTIQILLNDSGVFWPEAQILDAVNQAQLWAYVETKWQRQSWPITLPLGTDLFTLPSDLLVPSFFVSTVVLADGSTANNRAFCSTQRELEHFLRTWRSAGLDAPQYFIIWDSTSMRCFPRPDKTYNYVLWGVPYPPEVTSASQDLVGPPNYQQIVQNATMSNLLTATRPDLAIYYNNLASKQTEEFRKHLRNFQSHNIRRLKPSTTHLEIMQGGAIRELPTWYPMEGQTGN